jgi:hypothetical protein
MRIYDPDDPLVLVDNTAFNDSKNNDLAMISYLSQLFYDNYDSWKNNEEIKDIINVNKNKFSMRIKYNNPELDDISTECYTLGFYMYCNIFISNIVNSTQ